jgi:hypothetical protein
MNLMFLLLAFGSLDLCAPRFAHWRQAWHGEQPALIQPTESMLVMQTGFKWPKLDPRDGIKDTVGGIGDGNLQREGSGSNVPSIGRSQLKSSVPNYEETAPRTKSQQVKTHAPVAGEESPQERPLKTGSRYGLDEDESTSQVRPETRQETKPTFSQPVKRDPLERETHFPTSPSLRTSAMRQSAGSRELAPSPYEIRPASATDDEEETERQMPYKSYAIDANEGEENFDVEAYTDNEPPRNGRRNSEKIASTRGDVRDTKLSASDREASTLQGDRTVPDTNPNNMFSFAVVLLLLIASLGGNFYLAWVAREFYERYRSLAQQVRASRSNLT